MQVERDFIELDIADYPLVSKKAQFRKFRPRLSDFLESLVAAIVSGDLLVKDPMLMAALPHCIATLCHRHVRAFRSTSTIIALEMITHLAQQATDLRRTNGTTNRQLEAERTNEAPNQARIDSLAERLEKGEEKSEAVEKLLLDIFESFFPLRSRDCDPKIRIECARELTKWTVILPEVFFDGSYIRYLSWTMCDPTASTRAEITKALLKIFQKNNVSTRCFRVFMDKHKEMLIEMATRDVDTSVRATSVELLCVAREVGYLEPEDIATVGRLLFDSEQKVRKAVVPFFVAHLNEMYNLKIEELGGLEVVQEVIGGEEHDEEHDGPTLSWIKLKCLAEALMMYDNDKTNGGDDIPRNLISAGNKNLAIKVNEIVSRFSLAGAALWDAIDEVRDWEGLTRYILYDHSANSAVNGDDSVSAADIDSRIKRVVALDTNEDVLMLQILQSSVIGTLHKGPDQARRSTKVVRLPSLTVYLNSANFHCTAHGKGDREIQRQRLP